jgi:hypothetical protein
MDLGQLLGDDCRSSALYGSVRSGQVRLGGGSGESGLVRFSCGLWNDCENDHLSKRERQPAARAGCAGKVQRQTGLPDERVDVRCTSIVGPPGNGQPVCHAAHENASVRVSGSPPLCRLAFLQVNPDRQG